MATTKDVPNFGLLSGLKVLSSGSVIASPFAAALFAENGATVIHVESNRGKDTLRGIKYAWEQEHRNELTIALDTPSPEGREVFFKLIEWADIWIESSKGGTYQKWGLTDEVMWEHNPKLAIAHVSGYGQMGDPNFVNRPSYDAAGQSMGGYTFVNGHPEPMPPLKAVPYTCDYMTTLMEAWSILAVYINAQKTGKGDSVDIAQFEVMTKTMCHYPATQFMDGVTLGRGGNDDPVFGGYGIFKCGDGSYVFIGMVGASPLARGLKVLGLEGDPLFPPGAQFALRSNPSAAKLDAALNEYCARFTAAEVDLLLNDAGVPCAPVLDMKQATEHPHFWAREVWTEWEDYTYGMMKGLNTQPRVTRSPGKIWRSAPLWGQDSGDLLAEFGYDQTAIDAFFEKGIVR